MPIPLFNTVVSWILKKRKYQIDLFVKHPIEVQEEVLRIILKEKDNEKALRYVKIVIKELSQNEIPLNKLIISTHMTKRMPSGW